MSDNLTRLSRGLHSHHYVEAQLKNPTPQEERFKDFLLCYLKREESWRKSDCLQPKFQYPVSHPNGFYIIDVFFTKCRMGFEIDGGIHWKSDRVDYDLKRINYLETELSIKLYSIPNQIVDDKKLLRRYFKTEIPKIIEGAIKRREYYLQQKLKLKRMHLSGKFSLMAYESLKERVYRDSLYLLPKIKAISVMTEWGEKNNG